MRTRKVIFDFKAFLSVVGGSISGLWLLTLMNVDVSFPMLLSVLSVSPKEHVPLRMMGSLMETATDPC